MKVDEDVSKLSILGIRQIDSSIYRGPTAKKYITVYMQCVVHMPDAFSIQNRTVPHFKMKNAI